MAKSKEETFKEKERYKGGHGALGHPARSTVSLEKISRKNRYRVPNILTGFCLPFPRLPHQRTTDWGAQHRRHLLSHSSGGQKLQIKVLAGLYPLQALRENLSWPLLISEGCYQSWMLRASS